MKFQTIDNDGNKSIRIYNGGNKYVELGWYGTGDIGIIYHYSDDIIDDKCIIIDKSNCDIFSLFKALFQNISKCEIDKKLKKTDAYSKLVNDGKITWLSDDYAEEEASSFTIIKAKKYYKIIFSEGNMPLKNKNCICVRIRNSGSRYEPFNICFSELLCGLCALNEDCQQISIQEYLDQTKLVRRK